MALGLEDVCLRCLLYLPSCDALRFGLASTLHSRLFKADTSSDAWSPSAAFSQRTLAGSRGKHCADGTLWMHGLATAPLLADYVSRVKGCQVVGDVRLGCTAELQGLIDAMDACSTLDGGQVFIKEWHFRSAESMLQRGALRLSAPLDSEPLRLCWLYEGQTFLAFDVCMRLEPWESSEKRGGCMVKWEPRFLGEFSIEERDYLEVCFNGATVASSGAVAVCPWAGTLDGPAGHATVPVAVDMSRILQGSASVLGVLKVSLRSMGVEQQISLPGNADQETEVQRPCRMGVVGAMSNSPAAFLSASVPLHEFAMDEEALEAVLQASQGASGASDNGLW